MFTCFLQISLPFYLTLFIMNYVTKSLFEIRKKNNEFMLSKLQFCLWHKANQGDVMTQSKYFSNGWKDLLKEKIICLSFFFFSFLFFFFLPHLGINKFENLTVSRDKSDFDMRQLRANLLCQSLWNTKHDHVQNLQIGLELFLQSLPYALRLDWYFFLFFP